MNTTVISAGTLPGLARATVEEYITNKNNVMPDEKCLVEFSEQKAGTFVTLYKNGQLRGCIGTIFPTQSNVIEETVMNAISASVRDPRFEPVRQEELKDITYSVNVLMPSEQIESTEQLDPSRYGVIVVGDRNRRGLLLPRLEGIKTVEEQMYHVMAKAGIKPNETIQLYRFESIEHKE